MSKVKSNRLIPQYEHLGPYEVFVPSEDPKASDAIRVLFRDTQVVVKMFDMKQQELYSVKFWEGDIDVVVSYWRVVPDSRLLESVEQMRIEKALKRFDSVLSGYSTSRN